MTEMTDNSQPVVAPVDQARVQQSQPVPQQNPNPGSPNPQGPQGQNPTASKTPNAADAAAKNLETANTQLSKVPDQDVLPPKVHYAAKVMRGITDVLVPKQFKTVINPDGTSSQVPLPRSRKDIGMAIALGAITGAFTGLQEKGPGATGRAAAAGFGNAVQQRQQVDQQQNQQAQQDFTRKQATLEFNMKMRAGALQAGLYDRDVNAEMSKAYAPAVDAIYSTPEGISSIKAGSRDNPVSEDEADDIVKHSPFKLTRIPVGDPVARVGQDGKQVWIDPISKKVVPDNTPGAHPAWDHRYILVDYNAQIPLSDANGPKDWVKNMVDGDYAQFIPGASKALTAGKGASGTVPLSSALSMIAANNLFQGTQGILDRYYSTLNEGLTKDSPNFVKPMNLVDAMKRGIIDSKALQAFQNAAGNTVPTNSTEINSQLTAVMKADPRSGNKLMMLFGGGDRAKDYEQKVVAKGEALKKHEKNAEYTDLGGAEKVLSDPNSTPEEKQQAQTFKKNLITDEVSRGTQIAQARNTLDEQEHQKQLANLTIPPNWGLKDVQQIAGMRDPFEVSKTLASKGVTVPPLFADLFAVSKYDMSLDQYTKRLTKGTGQMDEATAGSYIRQFLNPNYSDTQYLEGKRWREELGSSQVGKAGGTLLALGTAVRHLDDYKPVFQALNNGGIPAFNAALNSLAQKTGHSPQVEANIITHALAAETEKVIAGSSPLESRMKDASKDIDRNLNIEQTAGMIKTVAGLMNDRALEMNDRNMALFGAPLKEISPHTTEFMKTLGLHTPWEQGESQTRNPNIQQAQQDKQTKLQAITLPGGGHPVDLRYKSNGDLVVSDGKQWIDMSTGKPYVAPTQPR